MKINLNKISIFFLFFLIFFSYYFNLSVKIGIGTLYYSQIFFAITFTYYLFFNVINRKIKIDYFFIFSLLILISILLSLLINFTNIKNINFIPVMSLIIFLMSFKYLNLVTNNKEELNYIVKIIYFFLLINLLFNFIDIFNWVTKYGFNYSNYTGFLRPMGLASSPVESTIYILIGYYASKLMGKNLFYKITKYLFIIMLFLSLSRLGILIGFIILFFALLNIYLKKIDIKRQRKLYTNTIIIISIIFIFLEYLYFYKGINILFLDRFNDLFNSNLNTQRFIIYKNILMSTIYDLKTLLIGNGFHNVTLNSINGTTNNPHSTYLSILSYQGLFGLLIFLSFLISVISENIMLINKKISFTTITRIKLILNLQFIYLLIGLFDTIYVSLGANIIVSIFISIPYTLNKLGKINK
jgi:hypothetical protein